MAQTYETFGDGGGWTFHNGAWQDGPDHELAVPADRKRQDGPALQGHHYAIRHDRALTDVQARFQVRLGPHGDAGLIFRAASPARFLLLHFPDCGQASRAQHFWAAVSQMDGSGYLRALHTDLVRRVSSTTRDWLDVDVHRVGERLSVRVGELGVFHATHPALAGSGCVGVYTFGNGEIRQLRVMGQASAPGAAVVPGFRADEAVPQTWFHPVPDEPHGRWQRPGNLARTPGGDLLLAYTAQEDPPHTGKVTALTTRSTDGGRTWSTPERLGDQREPWTAGILHRFPDGALRLWTPEGDGYRAADTADDGRSWTAAELVAMPAPPAGLERVHLGPQAFCNLADGSVVMFGYGGHASSAPASAIYTWGAMHCQAFASRSVNGGRTWSPWVGVDQTVSSDGRQVDGSLDLTEVCGAQIADGRIVALVRPVYSPWMWETRSGDGGATWTSCVRGPFPGYATPNMARTAAGALLVAHRLPGCTVHVSHDDGRTWDAGTMIDSAIWVMGSMLEVEPDVVLYIYYDSFESLMRAQFLRVTPEGLRPELLQG